MAAVIAFVAGTVDDGLTVTDWINGGITLVTAVGVYVVPNVPDQPWAKAVVAIFGAMLVTLAAAVTDGAVTDSEWLTVILAAFGAVGVATAANGDARPAV
jgi:hypothetical protein